MAAAALVLWRGFWVIAWFLMAGGGMAWVARVLHAPLYLRFAVWATFGCIAGWQAWNETKDDGVTRRLRQRRSRSRYPDQPTGKG